MRAQGGGVILNLITTKPVAAEAAAFIASMTGLNGLTLQAKRELEPYGIRVHALESDREGIADKVFSLLAQGKEER
jgi:NAD(P)-dependent dehydrogenase (short-subunit alcohol dehydrogenase family)